MTCKEKKYLTEKKIYEIVKFLIANEFYSLEIKQEKSPHLTVFIKKKMVQM